MLDRQQLSDGSGPVYRQIADAIASSIAGGAFAVGDKLPPQRDLAREAGVNLTTITRAFAELQKRGIVASRPGRGSVVLEAERWPARFKSAPHDEQGLCDLSVNRPASTGYLEALACLMPVLASDPRYTSVQDFHSPAGPAWAREIIGGWFASLAGLPDPLHAVITNGTQHGLACALGAVASPGDSILCDAVTYQAIIALCRSLGLRAVPVATDDGGMVPEEMARACRAVRPKAVFLVPTLHNPTTVTLSEERRLRIAELARAEDLLIIEDDVYRALKPDAPASFGYLAPDITIHVTSFSKSVAPGLRLGVVFAPATISSDIASMLRIDCWSTSALNALIAARLIEDGYVGKIIAGQREEIAARQEILAEALSEFDVAADADSPHAWLRLAEPWRVNNFVRVCGQNGVAVLSGEVFAAGRDLAPHAVRINVGAARSREQLAKACGTIRQVLQGNRKLIDVSA